MTEFINGVAQVDGDVGGLYGINVETLTGNKTLTSGTDEIYQYLNPGTAGRIVTLDTASATAGDRFVIRNTGAYDATKELVIRIAAVTIDTIWAGDIRAYIFNGTTWVAAITGSGEAGTTDNNVGIGTNASARGRGVAVGAAANSSDSGVAVGFTAQGYNFGVAVGHLAYATDRGVAVGYYADGASYGVALGYEANTNLNRYSIAVGYWSETVRAGETSINIDATGDQENNVVQGRWALQTNNATPAEMFCGGYSTNRFTIRASSALAFTMKIVARDNVAGEVAMYTVNDGLIKRDAAGNTTMVNCTVVEVADESTDWAVAVTADDTNEALIITVTGDADNATQWAAVMDGVETHF